jgi:uncharacterized protein involved in outer membrane biogenesis
MSSYRWVLMAPSRQLELAARKLVLSPLPAEMGDGETAPGQGTALQADEAHFSLHLLPLLHGTANFNRVELQGFRLSLSRDPDELERLRQLIDGILQ